MPHFTLIAYRPSRDDYIKGCHMGSSDEELEIVHTEDITQLTKVLSDLMFRSDTEKDYHIDEWEFTILFDGRCASDREYSVDGVSIDELDRGIRLAARKIANAFIEAKKIADATLAQHVADEAKSKKIASEKALLTELQEKYS